MKRSLGTTLALLTNGATLTTTALFEAGWVSRSTLGRHLRELEASGLVKRARGRGNRADAWTISAKGVIVSGRKAAA